MKTVIPISTIETPEKGYLSFFEGCHDINFKIKRIFYIYGVAKGTERGGHAHKTSKQFLFCPFGSIKVIADDGHKKLEYILSNPSFGLLFESRIWLDLQWLATDSVLCVASSEYYDENDYIRDYTEFQKWIK